MKGPQRRTKLSSQKHSTPGRIWKTLQCPKLMAEHCGETLKVINVGQREGFVSSVDGYIQYAVSLVDRYFTVGTGSWIAFPVIMRHVL